MRTAGILVVAALSFVPLRAGADASRAWTAAKASLPADAKIVIGVDFAAIQKTQLFTTYYPKLRDKPEVAQVLDVMKDSCKLDPLTTVQGVVIATAGDRDEGAVFLSITGVDRAALSACLLTAGQTANKTAKVTLKQDGAITVLTEPAGASYFGWIGKDVIVVSTHGRDRAALQKWMGGKGALARTELGKALAKVNTAAPLWGAGQGSKELQPGVTATGGYGSVAFANGTYDVDLHGVLSSPAQATSMVTTANQQLAEAKKGTALPAPVVGLLKTVTIVAAKDEAVIKASLPEKDLMGVVAMALAMGGP